MSDDVDLYAGEYQWEQEKAKIEALESDNARLRAALKAIYAEAKEACSPPNKPIEAILAVRFIAASALKPR